MADVARKCMGDAPIAYVEGVGGIRVSEDDTVAVGKNDVGHAANGRRQSCALTRGAPDSLVQGRRA